MAGSNDVVGFVDSVVSDPANPPDVRMLRGYVGKSSVADHTRLYDDPELSVWWEIPNPSITHRAPVSGDPLGAQFLWVQRDAVISRIARHQPEVRAKFLSGDIQRHYMATAAQPSIPPSVTCPGTAASASPACTRVSSYDQPCTSQCKTVAGYCAVGGLPTSYDGPCASVICETAPGYCEGLSPPSYDTPCASQCKTVSGYCYVGQSPPSYDTACASQCKTVSGYCYAGQSPPSYDSACASQCKTVSGYCQSGRSPPSYDSPCASQCKTVSGYCLTGRSPPSYEGCPSQCKTVASYCC